MGSSLRVSRYAGVLILQLDSPDGFGRLTRAVLEELEAQLRQAPATSDLAGVVLAGTERAFAAGADLAEVSALDALEALRFSAAGQRLTQRIERSPMSVVAAIRGYCLGGGLDVALACRLRVAAADAVFGHPGGSLGIVTGWGGTARLSRILGRARALELLTTGRTITGAEAYGWGLVSRVVEPTQVLATALELARLSRDRRAEF
jgi:enoyl-CoA hydratase/carnithine racemase